jgi:hypothetical protein
MRKRGAAGLSSRLREVVAMAHLKARDHGDILVYPSAGHALAPGAIVPSTT